MDAEMSKVEQLKAEIIKHGGFILSDGTLNLTHLLPKAYDLMVGAELDCETLKQYILAVFNVDAEDLQVIREHGLFFAQYHGMCKVAEDKQIEASEIWNEDVFNLFNNISPEGFSFGSSEGDGACIGWFKYEYEEETEDEAEEVERITLDELTKRKNWSEAVIVFKQESFGCKRRQFSVEESSY